MDDHFGPQVGEVGSDNAIQNTPWCFARLAFHDKAGNGLANLGVSTIATDQVFRFQNRGTASFVVNVGNLEGPCGAGLGCIRDERRASGDLDTSLRHIVEENFFDHALVHQ
jgi:hypothetical protein